MMAGNAYSLPTQGPLPRPPSPVPNNNGGLFVPSSFGAALTTSGPEFSAKAFAQSERVKMLEYREQFYKCTQHDWKVWNFNGQMIRPGPPTSQPMLSAMPSPQYVPLEMRRPLSPYRIAKVIVSSFTGLLFGYGHWPVIATNDPVAQDFATAIATESNLESVMIRARNLGGSVGTVGLSWKFVDGSPRVTPHNGKHLHVHSWADRDALIPEHVTEIYRYPRDEYDRDKKQVVRRYYWFRRDWTPTADVQFLEVEDGKDDPVWTIDESRSFEHNDCYCHFVWVQNLPEDDATSSDGSSDYPDLYENFNSIDTLNSVTVRGANLNLDPTLKLKMDPQVVSRFGVSKGSDNALVVGKDGDASYMELSGSSMAAGVQLFNNQRSMILEIAQCVIPDPNTITAAGTSSVALKIVFGPMLAKCSLMRTQYGKAIGSLLTQMIDSAKSRYESNEVEVDFEPDPDGNLREVSRPIRYFLKLPPRIEKEQVVDPHTGLPTGEETIVEVDRSPGKGGPVRVEWGDFFASTAADDQATVQTISTATGGKPVISRRSAVAVVARHFGLDPDREYDDILIEDRAAHQAEAAMYPSIGGEVMPDQPADQPMLDPAAEPPAPDQPTDSLNPVGADQSQKLELTATDLATIVSVNEGRKSIGLGALLSPNGQVDPDGDLTIAEFSAKRKAKGEITGEAAGEALNPKPPPTPSQTPLGAPLPPQPPVGLHQPKPPPQTGA